MPIPDAVLPPEPPDDGLHTDAVIECMRRSQDYLRALIAHHNCPDRRDLKAEADDAWRRWEEAISRLEKRR